MSGEQHPSYVLYGRQKGRRVAVYVPEELVPEVQRGLDNGRALQELLQQAAPRYVKALKRERAKALEEQEELSGVESGGATDQFCRLGADAARYRASLEPVLQAISDFLDDQRDLISSGSGAIWCGA